MSETVKVRVPIHVGRGGDWFVPEWYGDTYSARDEEDPDNTRNMVERPRVVYWLTAELPIPQPAAPVEIQAGVEEGGK